MSRTIAPPPRPASPAITPAAAFEQLDGVLRLLLAEHETLLALTSQHRAAISAADGHALGACIGRQNEVVQRIASLEKQRQAIVSAIVRPAPARPGAFPQPAQDPSLSTVASFAPEPIRMRIIAVAGALRDLLNRLHNEHLAVKVAAETLSAHMEGLMRQVCQRLSHAGTYARGGAVSASVQVVSSMDLRT
jgi:hypothetical protein